MSKEVFIKEYNSLCEKHLTSKSKLSDLTLKDFHIWITGQTMLFGRSYESSLKNADLHIKDRAKAEKLFTCKDLELL